MASLIRTIQTGLSVSLLFLLQAQLNFLHLENNAEDDNYVIQNSINNRHQPPSKSKIFDSFIIIFFDSCNSMILSYTTILDLLPLTGLPSIVAIALGSYRHCSYEVFT